nr:ABC transporter ATP-binding protein [Propionicimonas sp.]
MRVDLDRVAFAVGPVRILHEVTADIGAGSVVGLIGPNGSGKTTLLRLIAGIARPSGGRIEVDGLSLAALSGRDRARRMALVEQHATTGLDLTVAQVIELGRIPHRGRWPSRGGEGAGAMARAARLANVEDLLERSWATLSGGERQRVHLARALAQEPELLLLDEPTNHLDLGHQLDFLQRVRELGLTTIAALHDLELAVAYCDQVLVLDRGRSIAFGTPAEVITSGLLDRVYRIEADLVPHPHQPRPHLVWSGVSAEHVRW